MNTLVLFVAIAGGVLLIVLALFSLSLPKRTRRREALLAEHLHELRQALEPFNEVGFLAGMKRHGYHEVSNSTLEDAKSRYRWEQVERLPVLKERVRKAMEIIGNERRLKERTLLRGFINEINQLDR